MGIKAYPGDELQLFAFAKNWKAYYARHLGRCIRGDVLEVGAGIGGTTRVLCSGTEKSWVCLEPDPSLADELQRGLSSRPLPTPASTWVGTIADLPSEMSFDTILYIDVLEHIDDDRCELQRAAARLRSGGSIVVLSPAWNFLFSEFDRAIGHYRRYSRRSLSALTPAGFPPPRTIYLDSLGMLLSLANRLLLRSGHPSASQIQLWDRFAIPCSRILDPLTGHRLGKTVVAIWTSPG